MFFYMTSWRKLTIFYFLMLAGERFFGLESAGIRRYSSDLPGGWFPGTPLITRNILECGFGSTHLITKGISRITVLRLSPVLWPFFGLIVWTSFLASEKATIVMGVALNPPNKSTTVSYTLYGHWQSGTATFRPQISPKFEGRFRFEALRSSAHLTNEAP